MTTQLQPDPAKVSALAKDLTKEFPRSPRKTLAGHVLGYRMLDKCRAELAGTNGEYHFDCPLDNMILGFAEVKAADFKNFVATGASDAEVEAWFAEHAKPHTKLELAKWNNGLRYRRLSEAEDRIQEYMEDYIPANIPEARQHLVKYFFDIYDVEEQRI